MTYAMGKGELQPELYPCNTAADTPALVADWLTLHQL